MIPFVVGVIAGVVGGLAAALAYLFKKWPMR
jgi:hypothetical protein